MQTFIANKNVSVHKRLCCRVKINKFGSTDSDVWLSALPPGWGGKNRTFPARVKVSCPTTRLHPNEQIILYHSFLYLSIIYFLFYKKRTEKSVLFLYLFIPSSCDLGYYFLLGFYNIRSFDRTARGFLMSSAAKTCANV